MSTTINKIETSPTTKGGQNIPVYLKFLTCIALLLILVSACSDDDNAHEDSDPVATLLCKNKPGQIAFGRDNNDIEYNTQGQPVKVTTTRYNPTSLAAPPVVTVYTIEYSAEGKATKVSKTVNNQPKMYYEMEYNSSGQLTKQSEYHVQGGLTSYTTAEYEGGVLSRIVTDNADSSIEVSSMYQYADGNLVKKSVQNLYDVDSEEYYQADYTYTYFADKEIKIKPYFEGPLGQIFISNLTNQESLQYQPVESSYQLFYARETALEKKMLKNLEIIAHRYNTSDTTNIDYVYEYDADGYPTMQRATYKNITRREVPTEFGVPMLLVTPHNSFVEKTVNYSCN